MSNNKRVLVAMSGGVDSSVAVCLLLEQGYECVGVTMRLYDNECVGLSRSNVCCSIDDVEDARTVAARFGIPHCTLDLSAAFKEKVINKFIASYERGDTPNPCIDCNRYMKFELLLSRAGEFDCDYIATGHYVKRVMTPDGRYLLKKAADASKDQSYVLYSLTQEQLARTLFPLGELRKSEVRDIAEERGLINARKHDSQDICFVPDGDYTAFLERTTGKTYPEGDLIDLNGRVLGRHRGAEAYTIGQRKGLGIAAGSPLYVCAKDMAANTVTVGPESALYSDALMADDWNWIVPPPEGDFHAMAKVRYRQQEQPATVSVDGGRVILRFDEPQRAITTGQAAVIYDGDIMLGGGTIIKVL